MKFVDSRVLDWWVLRVLHFHSLHFRHNSLTASSNWGHLINSLLPSMQVHPWAGLFYYSSVQQLEHDSIQATNLRSPFILWPRQPTKVDGRKVQRNTASTISIWKCSECFSSWLLQTGIILPQHASYLKICPPPIHVTGSPKGPRPMTVNECKSNSTQSSMKNLADESWSTIPGILTPRCLLTDQDQDKPVQFRITKVFMHWMITNRKIWEIKIYHLKLAAYTSLFKETRPCLSSFKQNCSISHSCNHGIGVCTQLKAGLILCQEVIFLITSQLESDTRCN
jgi:hypothetical protein